MIRAADKPVGDLARAALCSRRGGPPTPAGTEHPLTADRLRTWSTLAVAAAGGAILVAALAPLGGRDSCPLGLPCLAWHFALFAALGAAIAARYATSEAARRSPRRVLGMVVLAIWLFAAATELAQGRVDGREPQLADWAANMAGGLAGLLLGGAALRRLFFDR